MRDAIHARRRPGLYGAPEPPDTPITCEPAPLALTAARPLLVLTAALPLMFALQVAAAAQDGGADAAFRPACELVSSAQVGETLGTTVTARDLGSLYCALEGEGVAVFVSLDEMSGIEPNRLVLPDAEDRTIAGHEALFSPAGEQLPATLVVALDDGGVLRVQVTQTGGSAADPSAATAAIAEAIFATGPVMARPPEAASGPRLDFEASVCDLVTLEDMVAVGIAPPPGATAQKAVRVRKNASRPLAGVKAIVAGDSTTCAVRTGRTAWCWGWDQHGKLGDGGDDVDQPYPRRVRFP